MGPLCPDFVGLTESKEVDFSDNMLNVLAGNKNFVCKYLPARSTAGGILVGVNEDTIEITDFSLHSFSVDLLLRGKKDGFQWKLVVVYGSTYDEHKQEFLDELSYLVNGWKDPTMFGGDDF